MIKTPSPKRSKKIKDIFLIIAIRRYSEERKYCLSIGIAEENMISMAALNNYLERIVKRNEDVQGGTTVWGYIGIPLRKWEYKRMANNDSKRINSIMCQPYIRISNWERGIKEILKN